MKRILLFVNIVLLLLSACHSSSNELQAISTTVPVIDESISPSPETTKTTIPTFIPTSEGPSSDYFERVEFLEMTEIPLVNGDESYYIRSSVNYDMDEDGINDAVFTITTYPENLAYPVVILKGGGQIENIADTVFPDGAVEVQHANQIFLKDINGDGLEDLLVSDAGIDHPPWITPDAKIGIGMNRGGGIFEDVSDTVPDEAKGLRNYSLAAGDLYNDGRVQIILPSQATSEGERGPEKTGLLFWNGCEFEFQQNWININLWWYSTQLYCTQNMSVQDFDGDGWQDLYASGCWVSPNHRILYGGEDFPAERSLVELPEGPYGYVNFDEFQRSDEGVTQGTDVGRAAFDDFDGDGDLDIISILEEVQFYKPGVLDDSNFPYISENGGQIYANSWFQVLRNDGEREFVDVSEQGEDLGMRYYVALLPVDLDLDGDTDLIGQYWGKSYSCQPAWGSTFFINEGEMNFSWVEDQDLFPELSAQAAAGDNETCPGGGLGLGAFFPAAVTEDGMDGLFVASYGWMPDDPRLRVIRIQTTGLFHSP
jgi:hypothetical protein